MARKNLLGSLMGQPPGGGQGGSQGTGPAPAPRAAPAPGQAAGKPAPKGAIGAVSQSIADLRARAVTELDPHLIEAAGMDDRLEHDAADHARLMEQIRDHGQQVPVLVRPHPETPGRFQIVYGRRRVLAARDLGIPVKAMIRALDDHALVVAQGQENTARRDLSFIEKANFARQMTEAGYRRKIVMDALSLDKTELSRMLKIAARIPPSVIAAVGAAPSVGRPRWQMLADRLEATGTTEAEARALAYGETSDARFEALLKAITIAERRAAEAAKAAPKRPPRAIEGAGGERLGALSQTPRGPRLDLAPEAAPFADWLAENLPRLHADWQRGKS